MALRQVDGEIQIKSRERVRDLAEVYTPERIVNAMLDLVGEPTHEIATRFLEPAAGNGNFLVKILERKLNRIHQDLATLTEANRNEVRTYLVVLALANIYAVDICPSNVEEARERLMVQVEEFMQKESGSLGGLDRFFRVVSALLETNIQVGDMLNGTDKISFIEFTPYGDHQFIRRQFRLDDLTAKGLLAASGPFPVKEWKPCHYLELDHE